MSIPLPKRYMFLLMIISGLFIALYLQVLSNLIYDWENNPDYSHGFLVPALAIYLVWTQREKLISVEKSSSYWGLFILILGIGQFIVGSIGAEHFLQSSSMIPTIIGIVVFLWGWKTMRIVFFPTVYLIFMIPLPAVIWNIFAFNLKLFATKAAVFFMQQGLGVVVLRDGNVLTLPTTTLEVVDACSGVRSLISLLSLSALICFISTFPLWKKWILFFSAIPIAIISNVLRLIITVMLEQKLNIDITQGISHTLTGIFIFFTGMVIFFAFYKVLSILPRQRQRSA